MLFLNISSDKVHISDGTHDKVLDRNSIEDTFGPLLIDRHKKHPFQEIFLINGPGGFTNLRVGTLMLNMLNTIQKKHIQIYSTDKLTLFARLVKKKILPAIGVVYLGQRHNVRLGDFAKKSLGSTGCQLISLGEIPADAFLDEVHDPAYRPKGTKNMIHFSCEKNKIYVTYKSKKHEIDIHDLKIKPSAQVSPEYMIEPILN